jgi:transcriptional regulator with XRE-family HTH domain
LNTDPRTEWLRQEDGLADQLSALRARTGQSVRAFGEAADIHSSRISRIENGQSVPDRSDIERWVAAAGGDADIERLVALAEQAKSRFAGLKRMTRDGLSRAQADVDALIAASDRIAYFDTNLVPGPLQTSAYTTAILPTIVPGVTDDEVRKTVASRARRWEALYDQAKQWELVMVETALHLWPGDDGGQIMRVQLDRIRSLLGLPNVRIGVIPMHRGLHVWPSTPFSMYDDAVLIETIAGAHTHYGDVAAEHTTWLTRLWTQAVDDVDSIIEVLERAAAATR